MCDEVFIKSLLTNLLSNATREDLQATFISDWKTICISNKASISSGELKSLNGSSGNALTIKGNGIGVELCHEIVRAHGWKLNYTFTNGVLSAIINTQSK